MAILSGINTKLRGSAGSWTFYRLGGQTVAKEKVAAKSAAKRTYAQMVRRTQWANIINFWRTFNGDLHPSFQNRPSGRSDFNEFVSANIGVVPVFLTRDQARQGGAVVAGYQVTRGSLPSIATTNNGTTGFTTDVALGSLTIGATTTVKDLSQALINNNRLRFANGDQISFFRCLQSLNATTQVPYVTTETYEITLDTSDDENLVQDLMPAEALTVVDGHLAYTGSVNGGICYVHSRKEKGKTIVSTQRMIITNSQVGTFSSASARDNAILSYGGTVSEEFLTPDGGPDVAPSNP